MFRQMNYDAIAQGNRSAATEGRFWTNLIEWMISKVFTRLVVSMRNTVCCFMTAVFVVPAFNQASKSLERPICLSSVGWWG